MREVRNLETDPHGFKRRYQWGASILQAFADHLTTPRITASLWEVAA